MSINLGDYVLLARALPPNDSCHVVDQMEYWTLNRTSCPGDGQLEAYNAAVRRDWEARRAHHEGTSGKVAQVLALVHRERMWVRIVDGSGRFLVRRDSAIARADKIEHLPPPDEVWT
jgi:hypothetical protein